MVGDGKEDENFAGGRDCDFVSFYSFGTERGGEGSFVFIFNYIYYYIMKKRKEKRETRKEKREKVILPRFKIFKEKFNKCFPPPSPHTFHPRS